MPGMIGRLNPDGSITASYVHSTDSVGWLLATHYTDPVKVDQLIALEGLSELGIAIGEPHDFYAPGEHDAAYHRRWCLSYLRDRDDHNTARAHIVDLATWAVTSAGHGAGVVFLWDGSTWLSAGIENGSMMPYSQLPYFGPWSRLSVDGDQVSNTPTAIDHIPPTALAVQQQALWDAVTSFQEMGYQCVYFIDREHPSLSISDTGTTVAMAIVKLAARVGIVRWGGRRYQTPDPIMVHAQ